jgi:hypothetical protein
LEDYVYNATLTATQTEKQVTAALYGSNHTKGLFIGYSSGGQGFSLRSTFHMSMVVTLLHVRLSTLWILSIGMAS